MSHLLSVLFGTVLVNHFVLARHGVRRQDSGTGAFRVITDLAIVSSLAFLLTATILLCLDRYLLTPFDLGFVRWLTLAGVSAAAVRAIRLLRPAKDQAVSPATDILSMANCALLTAGLQPVTLGRGISGSLVVAALLAVGFALALVAMLELFSRLDHPGVPAAFRGAPLILITAGLAALALLGLSGVL